MKSKKVWIAVAVVVFLTLAATTLVAYIFGGRDALRLSRKENNYLIGFQNYEQCSFTFNYLGLSDSQAQEYRAIGHAALPELTALHDQIRKKKAELLKLLQDEGSDTTAITSVLDEITSLQSTWECKTVDYILHLRAVLTDKQLAKYDRMVKRAVCPWL